MAAGQPCLICNRDFKPRAKRVRLIEYGPEVYEQFVLGRIHRECWDQILQALDKIRKK